MNNIERKLVITGCGNCPFVEYRSAKLYGRHPHICSRYELLLDEPYNKEKTHKDCMLPINVKSENII